MSAGGEQVSSLAAVSSAAPYSSIAFILCSAGSVGAGASDGDGGEVGAGDLGSGQRRGAGSGRDHLVHKVRMHLPLLSEWPSISRVCMGAGCSRPTRRLSHSSRS